MAFGWRGIVRGVKTIRMYHKVNSEIDRLNRESYVGLTDFVLDKRKSDERVRRIEEMYERREILLRKMPVLRYISV